MQLLLKTFFHVYKARVCITGFKATFADLFVSNYWLREFPLPAVVANRFQTRSQSKQLMLLLYLVWPSSLIKPSFPFQTDPNEAIFL